MTEIDGFKCPNCDFVAQTTDEVTMHIYPAHESASTAWMFAANPQNFKVKLAVNRT